MVSQVPLEVRTKLKDWVKAKGDGLDSDGALQFSIVVRKTLVEKGIPLDQGCRVQRVHDKVSLVETTPEEVESDGSSSQATTPPSVQRIQSRYKQPIVSQRTRSEPLKCYACGSSNHLIRRCPNKRCYVCGEAGHKPFDCPNKTRKTVDHKRRVYQVSTGEESVTIRVGIGSQDVAAMLDTGAKPSVMDIDTAGQLQLAGSIVPSTSKVYGLCDNPVRVRGYVDAHIRIGNYESVVERIQVIDSKEPLLLLGRSFMEQHGAITFDWDNRRIRLGRTWVPIEDSLSGATALTRARVARQEEVGETGAKSRERLINPNLNTGYISKVEELTNEYEFLFSRHHKRPSRCKLNEFHSILTEDAPPQRSRPKRIPLHWESEISRQLEEMLAADPPVCRPSRSPWSSDVVMVNKRDGTLRFAIDYRRLNAVTKRDDYSLPDPQSIFDKLAGNHYFSKLDIASAYWTIPVNPVDVEKTAFHTPRGMYEMLVMPFGLCNAPATFQRVMDRTFDGAPNCESYVDDILIFSPTFEEHLRHLRIAFQRLDAAGLQLRKDKCELGYREVEFLGHRISSTGRSPTPDYVHKLENFPHPTTVMELQRFLGTVNYYRCYMKDLSGIAEPLYALLRKGKCWRWDERCCEAFELLRSQLVKEHVSLAYPDWRAEFYVEADASNRGVAAVLSQLDTETKKLRPIQFFSSSLSPTQKNYSAGQMEAWALVAACRKWSVYLKGASSVILITDHCPLKWLKSQKDPKHTYARWLMELQELPFRIEYRSGSENQVADYLSRKPGMSFDEDINREEEFERKIFQVASKMEIYPTVVEGQNLDPVIADALAQLGQDEGITTGQLKKVADRLSAVGGVLRFGDRLVVPKHLQNEVIGMVHAQHHLGQAATLRSLRKNFFWLRMPREVKTFCRGCLVCQRGKHKTKAREPVCVMNIGEGIPGEAVAMDIGTLPWTDDECLGYRYFLLMVDLFTRYVEILPLKDQEAGTLLDAFEQGWVYRGHGMPKFLLTDRGANIDGQTFRDFCQKAGIDKKRTTAYHPQCDGMAERNIGLVKQVIRCLQMDRQLPKGSWPKLLSEVSFHINGMVNNTSRFSPHMLHFGHEPLSPIDSWCQHLGEGKKNSHGEYLQALKRKQEELKELAAENIKKNLSSARRRHNKGRVEADIRAGDEVMLRRNAVGDSLTEKYHGPFRVLERRGPDVKVRLDRRDNWVHMDNVKKYVRNNPEAMHIENTLEGGMVNTTDVGGEGDSLTMDANLAGAVMEQGFVETSENSGSQPLEPIGRNSNSCEDSNCSIEEIPVIDYPRYPGRNRKPPKYLKDYTTWETRGIGEDDECSSH